MDRKIILILCVVAGLVISMSLKLCSGVPAAKTLASTPDQALTLLKAGNDRYVKGMVLHPRQDQMRRSETVKGGQHPFATVVGCSDSRQPLEILFDQGVGDLFVVRVAGNLAGEDELGSIEYGTEHLGTPVLLILGHTNCGAVTATAQGAEAHGSIPALIKQIVPAVDKVRASDPAATGDVLVSKAIRANVILTMANILQKSELVRHLVTQGKLKVVGGIYDLKTGAIDWMGELPDQAKLIGH